MNSTEPMLNENAEIIQRLNSDLDNDDLIGLAVLAIHHNGKVSIQYSDYMSAHSAQTVGYLDVMRQELTEITRGR